ncbi:MULTISPECIES: hypothetical protein [unclassified Kitasatospora]|uniref:hypothetical protein n=1 Tax=unclassified Kitasatospora TaxID=2633591 RepID=UPI003828E035
MSGWLRGTALAGGLALIGYGLYGMLGDPYITDPLSVLVWAVGALVLHDGLWVPLLCLVGACAAHGPVLRGWLVVAAALTAVGFPAVLRSGDDHGNPSLLPLPYLRNWLLLLAATAVLALVVARARRWRAGRGGSGVSPRARPEDRS